jgi:acetyltransferase-like isoleucine patch superfamily enzyme
MYIKHKINYQTSILTLIHKISHLIGISQRTPNDTIDWKKKHSVGRSTYGEPEVLSWGDSTSLSIGSYCSIAEGVRIFLGGNHRIDLISTYPFAEILKRINLPRGPASKGDVIIGNDVWLGSRCTIMSGVTIGDGAVIGACSVVAKSVPPYSIVVGNPSSVIKKRFSDEEIQILLELKWWNWDESSILEALPIIMSKNINELMNYWKNNIAKH